MNEHPSLALKQSIRDKEHTEKQFVETLKCATSQIELLKNKYLELKEIDLTVTTLIELTDRLNRFEQKLDSLLSVLSQNLVPSPVEAELLAYLQTKLK